MKLGSAILKKNIMKYYYWSFITDIIYHGSKKLSSALTFWSIWWKNIGRKTQSEIPRATRKSPKMPRLSDLFVHGLIATRVSPQTLILVSAACALWTPSSRPLRRSLLSLSLGFPANDPRASRSLRDKTYLIYRIVDRDDEFTPRTIREYACTCVLPMRGAFLSACYARWCFLVGQDCVGVDTNIDTLDFMRVN